jgi:dipeptide transport system ATP-binding protein
MTALLDVRNLTVTFATRRGAFVAVDGADFRIERDEVLAVVGESGSGKSVAMLAVMGLLPWTATVTADRLAFDGQDLLTLSPRARRDIVGRDMAMIFQEPVASLNPCFTVGWQIAESLRAHLNLSRQAARSRAVELLQEVGIPDAERRASAFAHQLSGGMCQRVMIAMALACRPRLLIADEPTTALDVTIQAQIVDLLLRLKRDTGMGLVLITHDLGLVAEAADRVVVQYAGRQVETQAVGPLFDDPHHPYTQALLAALPDRAAAAWAAGDEHHAGLGAGVTPGAAAAAAQGGAAWVRDASPDGAQAFIGGASAAVGATQRSADASPAGGLAAAVVAVAAMPAGHAPRPRVRLSAIPGVVPGVSDHLPGCAFAPRCSHAFDRCLTQVPLPASAVLGHARCHAPLQGGQPVRPEVIA